MYWQASFYIVYLGLSMTGEQWYKLLLENGFRQRFQWSEFPIVLLQGEKNPPTHVAAAAEDIFISFRWWLTICHL